MILFCVKQDLALQGHRENPTSNNRGNFLEILNAKETYTRSKECHVHIRTSGDIQNDILDTMAKAIRNKITANVKKVGI